MAVAVEPKNLRDVLFFEGPNGISRTAMTLTATELGSVVNASGALVKADGAEDPAGVVVSKSEVIDYHAIVCSTGLVFPTSMSKANKEAMIAKLQEKGVKVR
ncbi:TPA: head decoration protein [Vibrio parahaemolyticus]|nr:head decoration protein [Vibrio parahaemolyticus]